MSFNESGRFDQHPTHGNNNQPGAVWPGLAMNASTWLLECQIESLITIIVRIITTRFLPISCTASPFHRGGFRIWALARRPLRSRIELKKSHRRFHRFALVSTNGIASPEPNKLTPHTLQSPSSRKCLMIIATAGSRECSLRRADLSGRCAHAINDVWLKRFVHRQNPPGMGPIRGLPWHSPPRTIL